MGSTLWMMSCCMTSVGTVARCGTDLGSLLDTWLGMRDSRSFHARYHCHQPAAPTTTKIRRAIHRMRCSVACNTLGGLATGAGDVLAGASVGWISALDWPLLRAQ